MSDRLGDSFFHVNNVVQTYGKEYKEKKNTRHPEHRAIVKQRHKTKEGRSSRGQCVNAECSVFHKTKYRIQHHPIKNGGMNNAPLKDTFQKSDFSANNLTSKTSRVTKQDEWPGWQQRDHNMCLRHTLP